MVTRKLLLCTLTILHAVTCEQENAKVVMAVSPGRFSEGAYYFVAGTEVNVTCTVESPDITSSDLVTSPDTYEIAILNRTSIFCVLPHVNETMNFACCVDRCLDPTEFSGNSRGHSSINIEVGDLPTYKNFSCTAFVDQNIICTWYAYGPGNWTLHYGIIDNTPMKNANQCLNVMCPGDCEMNHDGHYSCSFTGYLLSFNYNIVLTGQNDYGVTEYNTSSSMFGVTYRRMSNVSVHGVGQTWMDVAWQQPRGQALVEGIYRPLYNVTVTARGNVSMTPMPCQTTNKTIRLSMLHPYTNYTISLEAKPIEAKPNSVLHGVPNGVWSKAIAIHQRTTEAKPSHPPLVTPGGYSWSSDLQKLTVYWKAIPRENRNGEIVGYRVRIDTNRYNVPGSINSKTWDNIDVDVGHVVTVAGGTKMNFSDPAQMVIHPANKDLPRVDYVIAEKISSGSYKITWITSQKYVDNVTVTWCRGNNTLFVNNFEWTTLSNSSAQATIDPQGHTGGDLWFGVSLTFRNLSNGITWNKCIFDIDEENHAPTPVVMATVRTVHVQWGAIFCERAVMKSRPLFYVVIYTLKSPNKPCICDHGPNITIPALFNTSSIVIENLIASQSYCICMRIRTKRGLGPPSSAVIARLLSREENAFSSKMKVLVGLFSILILVFVILAVKFLRRRCKQSSYPIDSSLWKDLGQNSNGRIRGEDDGEVENDTGGAVGKKYRRLESTPHSRSSTLCNDSSPQQTPRTDGIHQTPKHEEELVPKSVNIPEGEGRISLTSHAGEELLSDRDGSKLTLPVTNEGYILHFNQYVDRTRSGLKRQSSSVTGPEQNQAPGPSANQASISSTTVGGGSSSDLELMVVEKLNNTDYVLLSGGLKNNKNSSEGESE
ncbi:leukemia inhibitory factor receptor-like isoform X2 [Haliotis asinina]|uniref:leukemia inhibitory factor receptor-like isoform X2 n=1 Tax=Haliotis asinina TaxID=109174 RepID=UPI00353244D1